MKILGEYHISKATKLKAWKWCLAHLPPEYVARHGRKLLVVARCGMSNRVIKDEYRARFQPQFRAWFKPGDYGLRWERTF